MKNFLSFLIIFAPKNVTCFSDDFNNIQNNKSHGIVCVFSLKNPSYPEFIRFAHCPISSIDVHPMHSHMLVVGLFDGNVAVFNLQRKNKDPAYISTAQNGKHRDVVWQVNYSDYILTIA